MRRAIPVIFLCGLYSLLFYFIFTHAIPLDYTCFYSGSKALFLKQNPYQQLFTSYFPTVQKVSLNVNPPIVLMLFIPLSLMSYSSSLILWSVMSFILGLVTASVSFSLAFNDAFLKQHKRSLFLLYLAFYPTLTNTVIGQLGTLIAFFIVIGYYFYTKKRDVLAGIMWGSIIAMKFFPGLLFFYALKQRRYRVMAIMAASLLVISLIPGLLYGARIYTNYVSMLSHLAWYGDNWNASINGFLFRMLTNIHSTPTDLFRVKCLSLFLFAASMVWFIKRLYSSTATAESSHQAFCLTLVMMLLMSPFGWMHYFPLLILPLCLTWSEANAAHADTKGMLLWLVCLFLMNSPFQYVRANHMHSMVEKLTQHSFYFYGLCLLTYQIACQRSLAKKEPQAPSRASSPLTFPIQIILTFGLLIFSVHLIKRLISTM